MLLLAYLAIAAASLCVCLYKCNRRRYAVYLSMAALAGISGYFIEEANIAGGYWYWTEGMLFLGNTPVEMILIYALLGFIVSVLTIYMKEFLAAKHALMGRKSVLYEIPFGVFVLFLLYHFWSAASWPFLAALLIGGLVFLKYRNPVIVIFGMFSAGVDFLFDTWLVLFGVLPVTYRIPYLFFFGSGVFFSGVSILLDDLFYGKKR